MLKKRLLTDRTGNLQDQILEQQAQEMAKAIDREVLWGMLEGLGWIRVLLPRLENNVQAVDIRNWLAENCKGAYETSGRDFMFESQQDANWFKLRWFV